MNEQILKVSFRVLVADFLQRPCEVPAARVVDYEHISILKITDVPVVENSDCISLSIQRRRT
jgi:hypothetical protein